MFSFDRLKYDKIPISENQYRIKYLTDYRNLLNDAFGWNRTRSGDLEEQRIVINERRPLIARMTRLAGINSRRQCARRGASAYSTTMIEIDVIEQMWELEALGISTREPMVVIEEAIGIYKHDQNRARCRTWNPFFWITFLIESIVGILFNVVILFGGNAQKARDSAIGRIISAVGTFLGWIAAIATILWFLGFQSAIQHLLHLS
jgi:hypothetical protein